MGCKEWVEREERMIGLLFFLNLNLILDLFLMVKSYRFF